MRNSRLGSQQEIEFKKALKDAVISAKRNALEKASGI
jgi:hypothetical protein